jgi:hypothetical protein
MKWVNMSDTIANSGNPNSAMIVSCAFKLPRNITYPHNFTVIATPYAGGRSAEAKFSL